MTSTAASYLEVYDLHVHGHMVAIMALMESPAIIAGLILISLFNYTGEEKIRKSTTVKHSFTNGSVLLILGSLVNGVGCYFSCQYYDRNALVFLARIELMYCYDWQHQLN